MPLDPGQSVADKSKPMHRQASAEDTLSRRGFLKAAAGGAGLMGLSRLGGSNTAWAVAPSAKTRTSDRPYNVLLIMTDEESGRLLTPKDYGLPARAMLRKRGTTFANHYIGAAMCTPSRGVMFSGHPPQVNGVFDQMELGYVPSLATDRPSLGTVMKEFGYATAYYGKFELRRDIIRPSDTVNYTDALKAYGFDSFAADGDKVGAPGQGYRTDGYTAADAVRWLRSHGQELNAQGTPWFMVVSFVLPHDIMYGDANQKGSEEQASLVGTPLTPPPDSRLYQRQWDFPLSPTHDEPMNAPGRPQAQLAYKIGWSGFLGDIPVGATDMWRTYYNYYLNLIRDNDRDLQLLVDALDDLALWDSTVVVRTADHGELAGSHGGLRGKGPLPYEEQTHVPFVVVHPEHSGGKTCQSLTSHIDLLPTVVGLSNAAGERRPAPLQRLPGNDFSHLLADPEAAPVTAIREGVLFNYVGLQTVDADYFIRACRSIVQGEWVPSLADVHPDLRARGFISFAFDGRYKFSRYYAPDAFNTPATMDELLGGNDVELFDLKTDPNEVENLAIDPKAHRQTILRMNALLNRLIAREVGVNDGQFLPKPVRPRT